MAENKKKNKARARRIAKMLIHYKNNLLGQKGTPDETDATDMLADFMHWCRINNKCFDNICLQAGKHFMAERDGIDDV